MEEKILDNIHVVLVEPKNPGNIGSSVRAMKNMGISHLRMVNPTDFRDNVEQKKLGYRSQDIIEKCQEFPTLAEAIKDISLNFLATARKGKWKRDFLTPEQAAELIAERGKKEKISLIFGREDSGVTIDESQLANYYIYIPSAITYPSLNLSQAVMVLVYQIYQKVATNKKSFGHPKMAARKDFERLHDNLWNLMKSLLIREEEKGLFYRSLKRALNRTRWTKADIAVFDRACKQVRWYVDQHNLLPSKEE
jgi:TrmH family RNA methyltransferase